MLKSNIALVLQYLTLGDVLRLRATCQFFEIAVHTTSKLNFFMENHVPSAFHRCYKTCVDTANLQEVMDNYGDWLGLKFRLMLFNDEKRLWRFVEYWLPPCTNTFPSIMDIIIDDLKVHFFSWV